MDRIIKILNLIIYQLFVFQQTRLDLCFIYGHVMPLITLHHSIRPSANFTSTTLSSYYTHIMERRTRSAAAREAALLAAKTDIQLQAGGNGKTSNRGKRGLNNCTLDQENTKKRQKTKANGLKAGITELPHNLGPVFIPDSDGLKQTPNMKDPRIKLDNLATELQSTVDKAAETVHQSANEQKKNQKKNPYGLTPGISPFPEWTRPTPQECEEVNRLLSSVHGEILPPTTIPEPSLTVAGCGEVPSVLDALIRTLLSGATTGNNSAMAFNGLVQRFGILEAGIGKGSVNWEAVRQAPLKNVFEAIKSGGLADIKSKNLKAILDLVHKENQERRDILIKDETVAESGPKQYEIACADQNFLSLNHLHNFDTTDQVMTELVKYPGIGPKTAACVILFCLQRPCFAVDTHIFRICKWLGWLPPSKAKAKITEVTAFSHLEVRIPDHLKYSLHQLFIRHGKSCARCRAITGQSSAGWEEGCVIDHLVTRTGKRKGL